MATNSSPAADTAPGHGKWLGWWAWAATILFVLWQVDFQFAYGFVADGIQRELDLSAGEATAVAALFLVSYGLMQVPAGLLLDRFGLHTVLPLAGSLGVASVAAFAQADSFAELAATRLLAGAAVAFAFPAAGKIARMHLPAGAFALAMALADMCFGVGAVLASWTDDALAHVPWRSLLNGLAIIGAVLTLHLALVLFRIKQPPATVESRGIPSDLRSLLARPEIRAACLLYAWGAGMAFGFGGYWNLRLQAECGCTAPQVSHLSTALFAGLAGGMGLSGVFGNSPARWRLLLRAGTSGAALLLLAILALSARADETNMQLLLFLFGASLGPSALAFPWATANLPPARSATAVGLVNAAGCLSGALAEALPAWLGGTQPTQIAVPVVYLLLAGLGVGVALRLPAAPVQTARI